MIWLDLPLAPSTNSIWRQYNGRTIISKAYREYKALVAELWLLSRQKPMDGRLDVSITVCFKDKRRADIANREKGCIDALVAAGAFPDDSQIDKLTIERGPLNKNGLCVVTIKQACAAYEAAGKL